jgi:hypothetical protein
LKIFRFSCWLFLRECSLANQGNYADSSVNPVNATFRKQKTYGPQKIFSPPSCENDAFTLRGSLKIRVLSSVAVKPCGARFFARKGSLLGQP